jgi:hypothetical protein
MMALKGRLTIHGRRLPSKQEAVEELRFLTGQNFGEDADLWSRWIKANRKELYKRKK